MSAAKRFNVTISTKGQMIVPKPLRDSRGWGPGVRLVMEDRPEGVIIHREPETPLFPPTRLEDVAGMLRHKGPPITLEDMDRAITDEAKARWERFERTGSDDEDDDEGG